MKNIFKNSIKILAVLILAILIYGGAALYSKVRFPLPSGPYPVGTLGAELTDSSRWEEARLPAKQFRRLLLQFWYPGSRKKGLKKAKYHPDPDYFVQDVGRLFNDIPPILLNRLARATTNALVDAPLSTARDQYPVIVFSHGMDAMRFINTYQMEELASHGYVVISIEHSYSATGTIFGDKSKAGVTPYEKMENEQFANAMVDKWSADQMFAISYLEKINLDPSNFFYRKLDMNRLGLLGFSFGGAVCTNTLVLDKRVKAGVNLDGFYYGHNYEKGFDQAFMEIRSQPAPPDKVSAGELKMSHLSRERWKYVWFEEWTRRINEYVKHAKNEYYSYTVNGADHFSFCDLQLMAPFPWLLSPRTARIHELTNQYTLAFFDKELKGINSPILTEKRKLLK